MRKNSLVPLAIAAAHVVREVVADLCTLSVGAVGMVFVLA